MKTISKPHLHPEWIDPQAYEVVSTLQENGHTTYLVGGCVRDLLLGIQPKDYDIGTTASPQQVKRCVRQAFIIGKRFRLVLVKRDQHVFEVATFRRDIRDHENDEELPEGDNLFGTPEEDARRRDFTINSLFYDPVKDELIDYAQAMEDLNARVIRTIGEPNTRFIEDPIRILRAIRLAYKIEFTLEPETRAAIFKQAHTLAHSVLPRRREEFLKFLRIQDPSGPFLKALDLGVLDVIAPTLKMLLCEPKSADMVFKYLRSFHERQWDKDNAVELFTPLVLAYVRSHISEDPSVSLRAINLLEHDGLMELMRNELGMFKHEQTQFAKALQLQSILLRRREFQSKGLKRQKSFMRSEAFPLALQLARKEYHLSGEDLLYWKNLYETYLPELEEEKKQTKTAGKRRRRPRRRRPYRQEGDGNPSSDAQ